MGSLSLSLSECAWGHFLYIFVLTTVHFRGTRHLLINLSFRLPSWRCCGARPAQVNTAPINTRGDDGSPQQRCDAAAGREQRDKSGGSSAQLFLTGDRLLRLIPLEKFAAKINVINSVHVFFFGFCLIDDCLWNAYSLFLILYSLINIQFCTMKNL